VVNPNCLPVSANDKPKSIGIETTCLRVTFNVSIWISQKPLHLVRQNKTIDQGGGYLGVFQKRAPLTKAQVGGNQGGFALVPL
jgi:hypothetical protein